MKTIEERNGFVIREDDENEMGEAAIFTFYVFHRDYDGIFFDNFETLSDAQNFCDREDDNRCEDELLNSDYKKSLVRVYWTETEESK
jgi:hypothetical protein